MTSDSSSSSDSGSDEEKDDSKKKGNNDAAAEVVVSDEGSDSDSDEDSSSSEDKKKKKKDKKKKGKKKKDAKKGKQDKKDKKDKKEKKEKKKKAKDDSDDDDDEDGDKSDDDQTTKYGDDACKSLIADMVAWSEKQGKLTPSALFDELRPMQVTLRFDNSLRMFVVLSILFKDGDMKAKGVTDNKAIIKHFVTNGNVEFPDWIWGFDAFLDANPQSLKGYPMVLKALYDEDIADESGILKHYKAEKSTPGFEAAAKVAAPFLKWLETADDSDEESGSGSGSGSDSD
mmetsp:Transcript_97433/g.257225  ORF Transcript_97433/g.257225 Transcript_97433/m.257225 type:complete len:286 (-) Transcript_97433:275-1132(-)